MQKMTLKHTVQTRRFIEENHDACTLCGKEFQNHDRTHLGYTKSQKLIYVGDCCSQNLKETIIRHSYQNRSYEIPSKETVLWRFMDFTKFVSLLSSQSLFFTRADRFEDPFEGAKGIKKNKTKWDKHYLGFFEQAYKNPPDGVDFNKSDSEIKNEAKRLLKELDDGGKSDLKRTFINCWHENPFESEAMWKLYTKNMSEGIAIQTTYDKLYRALNRNPSISIGRINYIDYSKRFAGINESFWFKRKSFEHEKEVRAIYKDFKVDSEFGLPMNVNVKTLINKLYVSPTAQDWFVDVLKDTLEKYELKKKIHRSSMIVEPFH
jgi:hypothetical protein